MPALLCQQGYALHHLFAQRKVPRSISASSGARVVKLHGSQLLLLTLTFPPTPLSFSSRVSTFCSLYRRRFEVGWEKPAFERPYPVVPSIVHHLMSYTAAIVGAVIATAFACAGLGGLYIYLVRRKRIHKLDAPRSPRPRISIEPRRVSQFIISTDSKTRVSLHKAGPSSGLTSPRIQPGVLNICKQEDMPGLSSKESDLTSESSCSPSTTTNNAPHPGFGETSAISETTSIASLSRLRSQSITQRTHLPPLSFSPSASLPPVARPRSFTADTSATIRLTPNRRRPSLSIGSPPMNAETRALTRDPATQVRRPLPAPPTENILGVSLQLDRRGSHIDSGIRLDAQSWVEPYAAVDLPPVYTP